MYSVVSILRSLYCRLELYNLQGERGPQGYPGEPGMPGPSGSPVSYVAAVQQSLSFRFTVNTRVTLEMLTSFLSGFATL